MPMREGEARLGILGGMGPQATIALYQRILDRTAAGGDQEHLPTLIWSDPKIPDRTAAILSGETETVYRCLLNGVQLLEQEGCTALAIPCNTSHFFADRLQDELGVPLLNMVRLTVAAIKVRGGHRVGILATDGTAHAGIYQKACGDLGLEVVLPGEAAQRQLMHIIYEEVKKGRRGSPQRFAVADADLRAQGCDCGVLACTELSVFRLACGVPEYYTDALEVLAEASIKICGYPLR